MAEAGMTAAGTARRSLAMIGIPWSADELGVAVRAAQALQARVLLLDTPAMLAGAPAIEGCLPIPVQRRSPELIAAALAGYEPDQVVAITELEMVCAARTRELLGLPGTSSDTERAVIDKHQTRRRLAAAGLTHVEFFCCPVSELRARLTDVQLPVVVKPRSFTGSHGVQLVRDTADLDPAVDRVLTAYDLTAAREERNDDVLVESMVPGPELSAEAMVLAGEVRLLALTDKVHPRTAGVLRGGSHHAQPVHRRAGRRGTAIPASRGRRAGVRTSPLHAELKLTGRGVELIELHTRFGGGTIVRLLAEAFGIDAYQVYFAAMLDSQLVDRHQAAVAGGAAAGQVRGVAFFGARPDQSLSWPSFDLPCPQAVVSIDYDTGRAPTVREHRGIRLQHWRAGSIRLAGRYDEVRADIEFMASIVQQLY